MDYQDTAPQIVSLHFGTYYHLKICTYLELAYVYNEHA